MRVVRLHAYGPPEELRLERAPDPVPGVGQVVVDVEAASVRFIETRLRRGIAVGPHRPPRLPAVLGAAVAGLVSELGPGVAGGWLGCRVVAGVERGGYAERAVAVADAGALLAVPDEVGSAAAVAMDTTGATMLGVLDQSELTPDDVLLVLSAAVGIGGLAVQAAVAEGRTVVGAARGPGKLARVAALGATVAIDYREPGWPARVRAALGGREVSVVFDGVGGATGRQALELLCRGGRVLLYGCASGEPTPLRTGDLCERGITARWVLGPAAAPRPGGGTGGRRRPTGWCR
ncbi:zinc-binding dehydrogenase [Prauserella cavernicola]|uniref:Zinc-binding dehydrogenase n=1 Tax=Prauserella cavernicola TaxID=2800127 RepID=A0A934V1J3_9PSEU|nr:zinc-binding dehydrogenase [Prauserella cavernicola]MBK1783191.1 zinc-binding dehydrogenase [Prauserella cavernicola]